MSTLPTPPAEPAKGVAAQASSRARIVEVAHDLFASHGYAGVGMRVVAERTGLSKSALFHHFPTKLALYGAVMCSILEQLEARSRVASEYEDPLDALRAWVGAVVDMLGENPRSAPLLLRALFEEESLEPGDDRHAGELVASGIGRAHSLLKRGVEGGRFRRVSATQTIQSVIGMIVYHFASGDFGDGLLGASKFEPAQIERRKQHVIDVLEQLLRVDG